MVDADPNLASIVKSVRLASTVEMDCVTKGRTPSVFQAGTNVQLTTPGVNAPPGSNVRMEGVSSWTSAVPPTGTDSVPDPLRSVTMAFAWQERCNVPGTTFRAFAPQASLVLEVDAKPVERIRSAVQPSMPVPKARCVPMEFVRWSVPPSSQMDTAKWDESAKMANV